MSQKFYEIIAKVMDVSESQITDESNEETIENWDSFNLYVLLDEIESAFNVKFTLEETLDFKKVGDFKKCLQKHGVNIDV